MTRRPECFKRPMRGNIYSPIMTLIKERQCAWQCPLGKSLITHLTCFHISSICSRRAQTGRYNRCYFALMKMTILEL